MIEHSKPWLAHLACTHATPTSVAATPGNKTDAEAKLAAIETLCHQRAEQIRADYPGVDMAAVPVSAASILDIIGSGEADGTT